MGGSFHFRNINTYVYEPEGESIITQPSQASMEFYPKESVVEEAPNDGNQYIRQNQSWEEVEIPINTSDLVNDSGYITTYVETDPVYISEKNTLALKTDLTKESIAGIQTDDSPQFADTTIPALNSVTNGGEVPDVDYNWFKGLYASLVDGSVKSFINGILSVINGLAARIGLLEDSYLLKYVVPVDTTAINLTTDRYGNAFNFVEGDKIRVIIKVVLFTASNRVNLRINDRSDNIYLWHSTLDPLNYFPPMISNAFNQYSLTDIELIDNEAIITSAHRYSTTTAGSTVVTGATTGLNSGITSLKLYASSATIPAGSVILIKKR